MTSAPRRDLDLTERRALIARLLGHVETEARDLRVDFEQHAHDNELAQRGAEAAAGDLEQETHDALIELRLYFTQLRAHRRRFPK